MHASAHGGFSQLAEPNSCQFYLFFPQLSVLHACKKGEPGPRMLAQHFFDRLLVVRLFSIHTRSCCDRDNHMPFSESKSGAFWDWKEDDAQVELWVPIPPDTIKKDVVCVISADHLVVKHTKLGKTLLHCEPLSGPVNAEESTWYLQGEVLCIVLAKQWRGETKSDQYWGALLVPKGGTFTCYMAAHDVKSHRIAREKREKLEEEERLARFKASRQREKQQREAEAAKKEAEVAKAERRRRLHGRQVSGTCDEAEALDDEDGTTSRQQTKRTSGVDSWFTLPVAVALGAAFLVLVEIFVQFRKASVALSSP